MPGTSAGPAALMGGGMGAPQPFDGPQQAPGGGAPTVLPGGMGAMPGGGGSTAPNMGGVASTSAGVPNTLAQPQPYGGQPMPMGRTQQAPDQLLRNALLMR